MRLAKLTRAIAFAAVFAAAFAACADDDWTKAANAGAFSNRTDITEAIIPDSVKQIGSNAFYGCSSLTNVVLGSGITNISVQAFANCTALKTINFPDALVKINTSAFFNCTALESVEFPESLATVNATAFANCSSLTNVDFAIYFPPVTNITVSIPYNQTSGIGQTATTNIQSTVTVSSSAFSNCTAIVSATLPAGRSASAAFPDSYENLVSVHVATGSVSLAFGLCRGCTNLESVVLPEGVTNVSGMAFADCTSLRGLDIPESITVIGGGAFSNCTALTSIELPENTSNIGNRSFYGCSRLTNVTIFCIDYTANNSAFSKCEAITTASVSGAKSMQTLFPDSYWSALKHVNILVPETDEEADSSDSSETVELVSGFCENCRALEEIVIPKGVTSIGNRAFFGCISASDSVTIPSTVTSIGELAFAHCREMDNFYYLGDAPTVSTNIYYGTKDTLVTGVLRGRNGWTSPNSTNENAAAVLPLRWPTGTTLMCSRRIAWWHSPEQAIISFYNYDGHGGTTNIISFVGETFSASQYPEDPSMPGYTFLGWWTARFGGFERPDGFVVTGSTTLYSQWEQNANGNDPFPLDPAGEGSGSGEVAGDYDFSSAHTFVGYLTDGDAVVGSATVTIARGRYVRSAEETNATVRATLQVLGVGKLSMRGTMGEDGSATLEAKGYEMDIAADAAGVTGSFEGYDLYAWENIFSAKTFNERKVALAQLDDHGGAYTVALSADDSGYDGYAVIGLTIGARGRTKVTGTMPDGTRVSATAQMIVADDVCCLPVVAPMYTGKKGGFGFLLTFNELEDEDDDDYDSADTNAVDEVTAPYELSGVSSWYAGDGSVISFLSLVAAAKASALANGTHTFSADISGFEIEGEDIEEGLTPDGTAFTVASGRWTFPRADTVRYTADDGYEITRDNGNPAALKLTYNARYGTFKGSFKLYGITEAGRSRRHTVMVNGVIVDGVGFGSASIKGVGAIPVAIE